MPTPFHDLPLVSFLGLALGLLGCGSPPENQPADAAATCALPTETACDGACVDTSSDDANCGACGQACAAGMACANSACVPGATAPELVSDNLGAASDLARGTLAFAVEATFSEPVVGVDASSITVDHGAYAIAFATSDQISYTFTIAGLRNATEFTVSFGAGIHNSAGVALVPTTRTLRVGGTVYYVVPGGRGTQDGLSPANAMQEPSQAASAANNAGGADVWVAAGTYYGADLQAGTSLYGGWDDQFTTRAPHANVTILADTSDVVGVYGGPLDGVSVVDGFTIRATHATNVNNFGVRVDGHRVTLSSNVIHSEGPGQNSAVYDPYGLAVVDASTLTAGGTAARGYFGRGTVTNSLIVADHGVYFNGNATLANCTLITRTCAQLFQASPVIANNVFVAAASPLTCIDSLGTTGGDVVRLEHNDFWGFTSLYASTAAGERTTVASLNGASVFGTAVGNISVDPELDAEGQPTSTSPASITQGGRDTSGAVYGTIQHDRLRAARTLPYSIGAFERD